MAEKKAHKYSQIHGNQAQLTSSFDVWKASDVFN